MPTKNPRRHIATSSLRFKLAGMKPYERAAVLFLLRHLATGTAGAAVFGVGLLKFNIGNLGTLLLNGGTDSFIGLFLLFFGLFVTFGSVAMGIGIMSIGEGDDQS